ncbi:hypothetical protein LX36DRAFT_374555 [Colletotrichum falcatum]|nr:hypothetical protein LX36DRAFT_374555 [Colletotrichum falcatum]
MLGVSAHAELKLKSRHGLCVYWFNPRLAFLQRCCFPNTPTSPSIDNDVLVLGTPCRGFFFLNGTSHMAFPRNHAASVMIGRILTEQHHLMPRFFFQRCFDYLWQKHRPHRLLIIRNTSKKKMGLLQSGRQSYAEERDAVPDQGQYQYRRAPFPASRSTDTKGGHSPRSCILRGVYQSRTVAG